MENWSLRRVNEGQFFQENYAKIVTLAECFLIRLVWKEAGIALTDGSDGLLKGEIVPSAFAVTQTCTEGDLLQGTGTGVLHTAGALPTIEAGSHFGHLYQHGVAGITHVVSHTNRLYPHTGAAVFDGQI